MRVNLVPSLLPIVAAGWLAACGGPMAKIEKLRDALASGDASALTSATEDLPRCDQMPVRPDTGCFAEIATALGSKSGFRYNPPDQASAATAAVLLGRDKHADWLPAPADGWLVSLRTGSGAGADALRFAVARAMAEGAPSVERAVDEEKDATALLRAVSLSLPGGCSTYALLGSGAGTERLSPEITADHSPCVQKDLERKDGPGGGYGHGTFRAAEGAVALWKDALRALREGLAKADPKGRAALEGLLAPREAAAAKIALKKLPPPPDYSQFMSDTHPDPRSEHKDGGAGSDAGAGAGGDAGAVKRRTP